MTNYDFPVAVGKLFVITRGHSYWASHVPPPWVCRKAYHPRSLPPATQSHGP